MKFKIQTDNSWDRCTLRAIAKCSDNNNQLAPGVQSAKSARLCLLKHPNLFISLQECVNVCYKPPGFWTK